MNRGGYVTARKKATPKNKMPVQRVMMSISEKTLVPIGIAVSICVVCSVAYAMVANIRLQISQHNELLTKTTQAIDSTHDRLSSIQTDIAVVKTEITTIKNSLALKPAGVAMRSQCEGSQDMEALIRNMAALSKTGGAVATN
jgi:hypothetical protein